VSIEQHPAIVEKRKRPGDWEADTMIGKKSPYPLRTLTITCENGSEFADYQEIAEELNTDVYFVHPYASWERATNENMNGLARQYFPKGSDFSKITDEKAQFVENLLNSRPRKCLDIKTLVMVFFKLSAVALET